MAIVGALSAGRAGRKLPVSGGGALPWTPYDLGPDKLLAAFDAENAGSLTIVNGLVSKWADFVTGVEIGQPTTAYRPVYVPDGLNGRPALQYDGSDDGLFATGGFPNLPSGSTPEEVWALARQDGPDSDAVTRGLTSQGGANSTNTDRRIFKTQSSSTLQSVGTIRTGTGSTTITRVNSTSFNGTLAVRGVFDANIELYVNNDAGSVGAAPSMNTTAGRFAVGCNATATPQALWLGLINSVFVTSRLSAAEVSLMWNFLKNRGGLAYNV
jgi:hypothetical protein